jgi:hypothetical protein
MGLYIIMILCQQVMGILFLSFSGPGEQEHVIFGIQTGSYLPQKNKAKKKLPH